jgi:hypothetical protein
MEPLPVFRVRNAGWVIDTPDGKTIFSSSKLSKAAAEKEARQLAAMNGPCELRIESTTGRKVAIEQYLPATTPDPKLPIVEEPEEANLAEPAPDPNHKSFFGRSGNFK